ncbi:MAG: TetR/AcrR family transcriptional regulator [Proteobacteria bacterium]|nr:TetR/AcrR family transcriptional regulator [Pseudomonadota bacterium]
MTRRIMQKERKKQILEATHRCLLKKPYDKTSIKEIAAEANVNHGMLHYYFKSKEDILLNYIEYIIEHYQSSYVEWLASNNQNLRNPEDIFKESINFANNKITLNADLSKIFIEIWEIGNYNDKVRQKLKLAYGNMIEFVQEMLVKFNIEEKQAVNLSLGIVAFMEGISLFSVMFADSGYDYQQILNEVQTRILRSISK